MHSKLKIFFFLVTTTYYVHTRGRNGCKVLDSITIKAPVHDYNAWPKDTSICYGQSFKMLATGTNPNIVWYEGSYGNTPTTLTCTNCPDPVATPLQTTNYYAVLTDADNCPDSFEVHVTVKPLPPVHIINNDTMIKYGQRIQLLVSGAYLYS